MAELRKFGTATVTATHIPRQFLIAGSDSAAGSGDWTPANGDVKVSLDGGAEADINTLPTYSNGWWRFSLTAAELTCKKLDVRIIAAALKSDGFNVETFGDPVNAMYADDFSAQSPTPAVPGDAMTLTSPYDGIKLVADGGFVQP